MHPRAKIALEAMEDRPEIRAAIEEQIIGLAQRLGPVRACAVTVKAAGPQRGGRFDVTIRLAIAQSPEIRIGPPRQADPRYTDLIFAISDTFRRAARRLRDQARALQGPKKKANRQADAVSKRPPDELHSPVADSAPTPVEPAAVIYPPLSSVRSESTTNFDDADGTERSPDLTVQPISPSTRRELPGPSEPPATAEPTLVEAAGSEAKPTAALDVEPSTLNAARYANGADTPILESKTPALAETTTDEPKQPAVAESATMDQPAEKPDPKDTRLDAPSASKRAAAGECMKANWLHPSPLRVPIMTPLGFLAAMGNFMRTAAVLNRASANWMNSYFASSVDIFNPTRGLRSSPVDMAAKTLDVGKP
jgi:hypothetical protein